jgi:hypothetical protein
MDLGIENTFVTFSLSIFDEEGREVNPHALNAIGLRESEEYLSFAAGNI